MLNKALNKLLHLHIGGTRFNALQFQSAMPIMTKSNFDMCPENVFTFATQVTLQ